MMNEQEAEQFKQALYQEPVLYEWEYTGMADSKGRLIFALAMGGLMSLMIWFFMWSANALGLGAYLTISIVFVLAFCMNRYLFLPDKHYCFQLTKLGIRYTYQDVIPDAAYGVVRAIAWVGILICILALFVVGPLAFVGAGAMALMSFGMTNFKSSTLNDCIMFSGNYVVFYLKKDQYLYLKASGSKTLAFCGRVHTPSEAETPQLMAQLKSVLGDMEIVEINRYRDRYKHPVYNSHLNNSNVLTLAANATSPHDCRLKHKDTSLLETPNSDG